MTAVSIELVDKYINLYDEMLLEAKSFISDYPDNIDGYNRFLDLALKFRRRAVSAGAKDLSPMPPFKTAK
jgi:hypothetical protein